MPTASATDADRWQQGVTGSPQVGDLWVVSWDDVDLGLVLIAAIRPSHVLVWPVTATEPEPSAPCFRPKADWLHTELYAWPEAEAGVSKALLSRRLGPCLDDRAMRQIHGAVFDGEALTEIELAPERDDPVAEDALASVCQFVGELSDIEWTAPAVGRSPIDTIWAEEHEVTPRLLFEAWGGPEPVARELASGRRMVPERLLNWLVQQFEVTETEPLGWISGPHVDALDDPERKAKVLSLARQRDTGEAEVRALAWEYAQRAARQGGGPRAKQAEAQVDQALDDLLSGSDAK
jgi:hypothetical protein